MMILSSIQGLKTDNSQEVSSLFRVHWQFSFTSSIAGGVLTGNCETCSTVSFNVSCALKLFGLH